MRSQKKTTTPRVLNVVFLLVTTLLFGAAADIVSGEPQPKLKNGNYEGTCKRKLGMAKVKVTIEGGTIAKIDFLGKFSSPWGTKAFDAMPQRILDAQSTSVDAVSGATYSSDTIKRAVEDALRKARAPSNGPGD